MSEIQESELECQYRDREMRVKRELMEGGARRGEGDKVYLLHADCPCFYRSSLAPTTFRCCCMQTDFSVSSWKGELRFGRLLEFVGALKIHPKQAEASLGAGAGAGTGVAALRYSLSSSSSSDSQSSAPSISLVFYLVSGMFCAVELEVSFWYLSNKSITDGRLAYIC